MTTPFFIIGNPRSGTTLLRLMLACHPDLLVTPECGFAVWLADEYENLDVTDVAVRRRYAQRVYACKRFDNWGVTENELIEFLTRAEVSTYSELAAQVYHCYGQHVGKTYKRWGDKNNFYLDHIDRINELYPNAQFIHLIRDGRDIACSYQDLGKKSFESKLPPQLPVGIKEIAESWIRNITTIRNSLAKLPTGRWMEIRFCDLVKETEQEQHRLCSFLGIPYSQQMQEYYRLNAELGLEPKDTMEWKKKTLEPPRADTVSRYLTCLSGEECQAFEDIAGDMLRQYVFPNDDPSE